MNKAVFANRAPRMGDSARQGGFVLVWVAVLLILMLMCASFAIDGGNGYLQKQTLQMGTDAAALSASSRLFVPTGQVPPTPADVVAEARRVANANGISDAELAAGGGIELGTWNTATRVFTPTNAPVTIAGIDSVRVSARRTTPTMLAHLMGHNFLLPVATAVSHLGNPTSIACMVPFGIEETLMIGMPVGTVFTLGADDIYTGGGSGGNGGGGNGSSGGGNGNGGGGAPASPGNWGKINPNPADPNGLNGSPEYEAAFTNGTCTAVVDVNDLLPSITGIAGLINGVTNRINANNRLITIAVTNDFDNGSGEIQVLGFAKLEILAQRNNGANWEMDLRLVEALEGSGTGGPAGTLKDNILVR